MPGAPTAGLNTCQAGVMTANSNEPHGAQGEERQVKDAPLRRSEEEAGRDNPDVGRPDVSEESAESYDAWEREETE